MAIEVENLVSFQACENTIFLEQSDKHLIILLTPTKTRCIEFTHYPHQGSEGVSNPALETDYNSLTHF